MTEMNKAPAIEVTGKLIRFVVVFTSASDHGHGGGDRSIRYTGFDIVAAIEAARRPADWGDISIEIEGWR